MLMLEKQMLQCIPAQHAEDKQASEILMCPIGWDIGYIAFYVWAYTHSDVYIQYVFTNIVQKLDNYGELTS